MDLLTILVPLGLLALLSLLVWLIIYIIKPNYIQKEISSTHVWRLSLKYKKRRIPINKLRNILIILCQVLILTICAIILAQPFVAGGEAPEQEDFVAIVSSSASMRAETDGMTRFERAINLLINDIESISGDGFVSIIIADNNPYFLAERVAGNQREEVINNLRELIFDEETFVSFGVSNIDAAIALSENIFIDNQNAQVYLYTDVWFGYVPHNIIHRCVRDDYDWNVGITDARAELIDGWYNFEVDLALHGRHQRVTLDVILQGANSSGREEAGTVVRFSVDVPLEDGVPLVVRITSRRQGIGGGQQTEDVFYHHLEGQDMVFSFQIATFSLLIDGVPVNDSLSYDNIFVIYGGQQQILRIQYASQLPNIFVQSILANLRNYHRHLWDIRISFIDTRTNTSPPATEGYDLYIFEDRYHRGLLLQPSIMPNRLPADGVSFLINPNRAPIGAGFNVMGQEVLFHPEGGYDPHHGDPRLEMQPVIQNITDHILLAHMDVSTIGVSRYRRLAFTNPLYETLIRHDRGANSWPMLTVKNVEEAQVIVLSFSVHFSNFVHRIEWSQFWLNMFRHYFPPTVLSSCGNCAWGTCLNCNTISNNAFGAWENIRINSRSDRLHLVSAAQSAGNLFELNDQDFLYTHWDERIDERERRDGVFFNEMSVGERGIYRFSIFPNEITINIPGVYRLVQTTFFEREIIDYIFVTIPASESNIFRFEEAVGRPAVVSQGESNLRDLLLYIAAVLLGLIVLERWLASRDKI